MVMSTRRYVSGLIMIAIVSSYGCAVGHNNPVNIAIVRVPPYIVNIDPTANRIVNVLDRSSFSPVLSNPHHFIVIDRDAEGNAIVASIVDGALKYGLRDRFGNIVVPIQFDSLSRPSGKHLIVQIDQQYGIVDFSGEWSVQLGIYDRLVRLNDEVLAFRSGQQWGLMRYDGHVTLPASLKSIKLYDVGQGPYIVEFDDVYWGAVSATGKLYFRHLLSKIEPIGQYVDSRLRVKICVERSFPQSDSVENQLDLDVVFLSGVLDETGRYVFETMLAATGSYSEGLAAVCFAERGDFLPDGEEYFIKNEAQSSMWGFMDLEGNVVIPMKYHEVGYFHEGRASVRIGGKWGFIDKSGRLVVPLRYIYVGRFQDGYAPVVERDRIGFIDFFGKLVVSSQLKYIPPY